MQTEMAGTEDLLAIDASKNIPLTEPLLYPLRFEPIYQYRPWGGRRLADLLTEPLPSGPIGEAWLLSDRDDYASQVAEGPLKGQTLGQLLKQFPEQMLGKLAHRFQRFPLLLKFLDAQEMLSVQVHPTKANANLLPAGETAKSEAWVVLEADAQSRIYAGLKVGTTAADLRRALTNGTVAEQVAYFTPKPGDSVFLQAGTVHSLGGDLVVFEIQQNSDVTFRLYDWGHVDCHSESLRATGVGDASSAAVSWNRSGGEGTARRLPRGGSRSRMHLDFLPPDFLGSFSTESRRPVFSSSAGDSDIALGMPQNRLRHSTDPHQARLARRLPRR
jgi:hypothetical protein